MRGFAGLAIVVAIVWLLGNAFQREVDGTVRIDDCRTRIDLQPDAFTMRRFTCDTRRTASGKLMGATCVNVELSDAGSCNIARVYTKPPELTCPKETPFLGYDDMCHATFETGYAYAAKD